MGVYREIDKKNLPTAKNICLRCAVNGPWYVRNRIIFRNFEQASFTGMMRIRVRKALANLGNHPNRHLGGLVHNDSRFLNWYKKPKN